MLRSRRGIKNVAIKKTEAMAEESSDSTFVEWTAGDGTRPDAFEMHGTANGFVCGIAFKTTQEGHDPILDVKLPGSRVVLIQVRHERGRTIDPKLICLADWMQREIENGRAQLNFEVDRMWLVHYRASELTSRHDFSECVKSLVDSLVRLGIPPGPNSCDYCPRQATANLYRDGRLVQMCDLCTTQPNRPSFVRSKPPGRFGSRVLALSAEIVRGALLWAVLTLALQLCGRLFTTITGMKHIIVPAMLEGLVLLLIGWFIGAPIGKRAHEWVQHVRRARMLSGAACLFAVLAGELLYVLLDLRIASGGWNHTTLLDILLQRWWNEGIYTFIRGIAAGAAIYAACATIEPLPATVRRNG